MIADQNTSFLNKLLGVNDLSNPSLTYSVKEQELVRTIERCTQIVAKQPILLEVEPPVCVCGDIHGQYDDLLRIFNRCGFPPDSVYVFLGDYVDRGAQQIETISLLMSYKIMYPEAFFFLRGNHECSSINRTYGFYDECKRRYSPNLYNEFQRLFDVLPLCVLIGDRILGMHGGISPLWTSWDQLSDQTITRPMEPAHKSLASDILWSDPSPSALGWDRNSRGVSYTFGPAVVKDFCRRMNIDLIVRAHQVVHDGYEFFADGKLVTIFSAPRYCGEFDNNAAIMCVSSELRCRFEILKARTRAPRVMAKPAAAPGGGNDNSSSSRRSARKRENSSSSRKGKKKR